MHVLKAMRHPYIITYKESFMDKRCLCIVMDYADGGDLYTKIANQKKIGRGKLRFRMGYVSTRHYSILVSGRLIISFLV